jgi:hypothetical protein
MFIAALFTVAKIWKQPRCPTTDKWIVIINNKCDIYTQWNFTQQKRRMKFCYSHVNIILSEVSQAQKAKSCMFSIICGL